MSDKNQPNEEDSYEVPIRIIESTPEPALELDDIGDPYAIICPICGHDEFEDIRVMGKTKLRWLRMDGIKFRWDLKHVQSMRCLRCDYILNFARE